MPTRIVADVDSLERATVQAVAPEYLDETVPGWLLPMDPGTVGRAQCAVPLSHGESDPALIDTHIERYRARGFAPAWRLPDLPSFTPFHVELGRRGFTRRQPTLTQVCSVADLLQRLPATPGPEAALQDRPDAAWLAMFLGEGLTRWTAPAARAPWPVRSAHVTRACASRAPRWPAALQVTATAGSACTACARRRPTGAAGWPVP